MSIQIYLFFTYFNIISNAIDVIYICLLINIIINMFELFEHLYVRQMFNNVKSFNQSLNNWNIYNVESFNQSLNN